MTYKHVQISDDAKRKLKFAALYLYRTEKDVVEEALEMYYDKRRIE